MMKSILIDALRQSQDKDSSSTLSDSGSFDTTQAEFGPTANDEDVIDSERSAEDLELLQTGVFNNEEFETSGDENLPISSAASSTATLHRAMRATPESMLAPAMARLAPLLCITLAISAAAALVGYRYFTGIDTGDSIGASTLHTSNAGNSGEVENTVHISGAGRFPFIDVGAEVDAGDTSE